MSEHLLFLRSNHPLGSTATGKSDCGKAQKQDREILHSFDSYCVRRASHILKKLALFSHVALLLALVLTVLIGFIAAA